MKKFLSLVCVMVLTFSGSSIPSSATGIIADDNVKPVVTEEAMLEYLVQNGYPEEIIQSLNEVAIQEIYEGNYVYQSSDVVYGILTEDYSITYEKAADGSIIIDDDNAKILNELLNDDIAMQKIINDKEIAYTKREAQNRPQDCFINSNIRTDSLSSRDASILTLSNWYATLTVNEISQTNTHLKKAIIYAWNWFYSPVWTLTDKAAVAWSKGFTLDPSSTTWAYKAWGDLGYNVTGGSRQTTKTWSGTGCTEYEPDCGFGQSIDIKFEFQGSNGLTYRTYEHGGSISGKIQKYLTGSDCGKQNVASAVGRYYHKRVGLSGSLAFSASGPSISISYDGSYDPSPDTPADFYFYKYD